MLIIAIYLDNSKHKKTQRVKHQKTVRKVCLNLLELQNINGTLNKTKENISTAAKIKHKTSEFIIKQENSIAIPFLRQYGVSDFSPNRK